MPTHNRVNEILSRSPGGYNWLRPRVAAQSRLRDAQRSCKAALGGGAVPDRHGFQFLAEILHVDAHSAAVLATAGDCIANARGPLALIFLSHARDSIPVAVHLLCNSAEAALAQLAIMAAAQDLSNDNRSLIWYS